jgi:two-component system, cell cycle response regulator
VTANRSYLCLDLPPHRKSLNLRLRLGILFISRRSASIPKDMMTSPDMKILLVEDSAVDRHNIGSYLKEWHLDFIAVDSGTKAMQILESPNPPTMALLDWLLPGIDGIELCRRIRTLGANGRYIYTVMLTAKNRKQDLLTAMAAGADDYLAKPVDASELRARIMVGKRILDLQQSLGFAATHDFLTDLLNRSEIISALQRELSRSEREGKPATVIMADVDHFKPINDSMGHAAGDTVLKEVAQRLKSDLRPYDLAGRYGGEEFLLILPACDLQTGIRRADEIRQIVARSPIPTGCGTTNITVSMGVTLTPCTRGHSLASVLQQADTALYIAKKNGRNRVEAFSSAVRGASAH